MEERPIQVGDWVNHPDFGEGLVLELRGAGESVMVTVSFSDRTQRKLLLRLARLTRLKPHQAEGSGPGSEEGPPRKPRRRSAS